MRTVLLSGTVGLDFTADSFREEVKDLGRQTLRVHLNSEGGKLTEALSIFSQMRELKNKVIVSIEAAALSAGGVIALGADEIEMNENALLMFHGTKIQPSEPLTAQELRERAEILDKANSVLSSVLVSRIGDEKAVKKILNSSKDKWLTAKEALDMGVIDRVNPVVSRRRVDISNFTDVPDAIVAMYSSHKKEESMAIQNIAETLELKVEDGAEDSVIEEAITNYFKELSGKVTEALKENEELKAKIDPPKEDDPAPISGSLLNMAKDYRAMKIDTLLNEAKISKPVADKLKEDYCGEDRLRDCLRNEDKATDDFDAVVAALSLGTPIVNVGTGKTGPQGKGTGTGRTNDDNNVLIRRAEALANAQKS